MNDDKAYGEKRLVAIVVRISLAATLNLHQTILFHQTILLYVQ